MEQSVKKSNGGLHFYTKLLSSCYLLLTKFKNKAILPLPVSENKTGFVVK